MRYGAEVMSAHLKRSPRHLGRLLALSLVAASVAAPAASVLPVALPTAGAADGLGAGGEYHPLAPARIYDSRPVSPVNEPAPGPKPANGNQPVFDIALLGQGGIPATAADVLAVVVNITVTEPTASGWLNAYGKDAPAGTASIVNFSNAQTVPNLSIVRPGTDGKLTIKLFSSAATAGAHVVVDVFGWFSTSANADRGARLVPITPGRILDTREGAATPLGQAQSLDLQIRGATLGTNEVLPAGNDIVGVVLNLTGVNDLPASQPTFLSVVPDAVAAGTAPGTSNVNLAKGQIKPNMVIVPIGADGKIRIYNNTGSTHVVVDVAGYLQSGIDVATRRGRVVPLTTPYRVFDTREIQWGDVPLGPGQAEDWSFADFAGSVNISNVAVGKQMAVIGNLTSAGLTRQYPTQTASSYLTVYPADAATRPIVSNLNTVEGPPVPNLAILKYSSSTTVRVYNLAGYADYLYDASAVVLDD